MKKNWEMPDPEHDMYGEPKYSSFSRKWMKVPVQYGNLSKRERQVIFLGAFGSIPRLGERTSYYRIGRGQQGAGRFFVEHRWKDKERLGFPLVIHTYYVRLKDLPQEIRDAIKQNEGEYHDWGTA